MCTVIQLQTDHQVSDNRPCCLKWHKKGEYLPEYCHRQGYLTVSLLHVEHLSLQRPLMAKAKAAIKAIFLVVVI